MNGLSLFTGSGIGELAFKQIIPNYRTVAYVEIDQYCRGIIRARIRDGILDDAPIFDDIRVFNERYASLFAEKVDFVSGGFPCQPFSVAGKRRGKDDSRNLWPETAGTIRLVRPRFALLENVPGLLTSGYFGTVIGDISTLGYDCEWDTVGASDVGARHRRKRVWILANSVDGKHSRWRGSNRKENGVSQIHRTTLCGGESFRTSNVANPKRQRYTGSINQEGSTSRCSWWEHDPADGEEIESRVDRVVDGVAFWHDRIRAIGNGWVPQVVARILQIDGEE